MYQVLIMDIIQVLNMKYRNVQTIDLMASRDLASDFCQATSKYGKSLWK